MLEWKDAKILIEEARALKYHGTMFERSRIEVIEALQPATLTPADEKLVINIYRKAAGFWNRG